MRQEAGEAAVNGEARKAAIAAYKKRERPIGIYELRCEPTGEVWVGRTTDLDAIRNRLTFMLDRGGCTVPALQKAWRDHGAAAFTFTVLERLEEEETSYILNARLKERWMHWRERLGAQAV
jgi:hypothetical protein